MSALSACWKIVFRVRLVFTVALSYLKRFERFERCERCAARAFALEFHSYAVCATNAVNRCRRYQSCRVADTA